MKDDLTLALEAIIGHDWANETTGHVDSPFGHVALIDLTTERDMMADILDDDDLPLPDPAWYVVMTNDHGFVDIVTYPTESSARTLYDDLDARYGEWLGDDDTF